MKKQFNRLLSLVLTLAMIVSMVPAAFAGDTAATATVYMTFASADQSKAEWPTLDKSGEKALIRIPVTVEGEDPTLYDALAAAHLAYHENGADAYKVNADTGWVTGLWGYTTEGYTEGFGFFRNGAMTNVVTLEQVADGDEIDVLYYGDYSTDTYAYFDKRTAQVSAGEALTLTLKERGVFDNASAETPVSGAKLAVGDEMSCLLPYDESQAYVTDESGSVTLRFSEPGVYTVSTSPDAKGRATSPCVITVTEGLSDDDRAAAVAADKAALTLPETAAENLTLPTAGASGITTISWQTSDEDVIAADGTITRTTSPGTATLTATISCGGVSDTKEFPITVPAIPAEEIRAALAQVQSALSAGPLEPSEWEYDPATGTYGENLQDQNIADTVRAYTTALPAGVETEVQVVSSSNANIAADGTISYTDASVEGKVTLRLSAAGETTDAFDVDVTVAAHVKSKAELIDETAALITFDAIKGSNTSADDVRSNLSTRVPGIGWQVDVAWSSSNEDVLSKYGSVYRPDNGQSNAQVTFTATVSVASYMAAYIPGPAAEPRTVDIDVTVPAYQDDEMPAIRAQVDAALAAISADSFTYMGGGAADLSAVTYDLQLKSAPSGMDEQWTSDFDALTVNTLRGKVTRPAVGAQAVSGKLTATFSKAGYEAQKTFDVTILPVTQEEIDAENARLDTAAAALTFDVIKGENDYDYNVTSALGLQRRAFVENGEITWQAANREENGIQIEWETSNPDVITYYGTFTKPSAATARVTMTGTLTSIRLADFTEPLTVEIAMTARRDAADAAALLENIAAKYVDKSTEWHIMGMSTYQLYNNETAFVTSETARQKAIDNAIAYIADPSQVAFSTPDAVYAKQILTLRALGADPRKLTSVNHTKLDAVELLKKTTTESIYNAPYVLLAYQQGDYDSAAEEQAVIDFILSAQDETGGWEPQWGADTTGTVLLSLAAYYPEAGAEDAWGVKDAVDRAVAWLSGEQNTTGAYAAWGADSANSTACAIWGLTALGIDPSSDARFIKDGGTLFDGLLSLATAENDGFIYGGTWNDNATEQAFRALTAAMTVRVSGQAYNVLDFSALPADPVQAESGGSTETPDDPSSGTNITVTFTLKGDKIHAEGAHTGSYPTWIRSRSVTVASDATVYHVFTKVLDELGYTYTGAASGYVSSITTPDGLTLAQFTNGPNSGWKYKVNGTAPNISLTACKLEDGDAIEWYYTDDWSQEADYIDMSGGAAASDDIVVTALASKAGLSAAQQAASGNRPAVTLTAADGKTFSGKAGVEIAYEKPAEEDAARLTVYEFCADGTLRRMADARYDAESGKMHFTADKLGVYGVVYREPLFTDVQDGSWSEDYIYTLAFAGIINGKTETLFAPGDQVTRAEVAALLARMSGQKATDTACGFDDVPAESWYAPYVAWAAQAGVTNGTGPNRFSPEESVTREDAAVLLARYLEKVAKTKLKENAQAVDFADADQIAPYAEEAVGMLARAGVLSGKNGNAAPKAFLTREEAAKILCLFIAAIEE